MPLRAQVRLGGVSCQKQALWALHNLVCVRLALGDEKTMTKLAAADAEVTLRAAAAQSRDATIRHLTTVILAFFKPEVQRIAEQDERRDDREWS